MMLKLMIPERVLVEAEAKKVTARADNGHFCLLPRHVDFVSVLVPGILTYEDPDGGKNYFAVGEGTLVKCGDEVMVSTRHATRGDDIKELKEIARQYGQALASSQNQARKVAEDWQAEFSSMYLKTGKE